MSNHKAVLVGTELGHLGSTPAYVKSQGALQQAYSEVGMKAFAGMGRNPTLLGGVGA